jgi:hypothetical protein
MIFNLILPSGIGNFIMQIADCRLHIADNNLQPSTFNLQPTTSGRELPALHSRLFSSGLLHRTVTAVGLRRQEGYDGQATDRSPGHPRSTGAECHAEG